MLHINQQQTKHRKKAPSKQENSVCQEPSTLFSDCRKQCPGTSPKVMAHQFSTGTYVIHRVNVVWLSRKENMLDVTLQIN